MLGWRRRRQREHDLDEEIAFDLAAETEERMREGVPREEAERASRRDFGNVLARKEDARAAWGWTGIERLIQDVRYGCRSLRRTPLFATVAVLSLALGIGANTAMFSVMDAVMLRDLPVRNPGELVILNWRAPQPVAGYDEPPGISGVEGNVAIEPQGERSSSDFPWPFYELVRNQNQAFADLIAYKDAGDLSLRIDGPLETGSVELVSGNFFQALGVRPAAGRLLDPRDDAVGAQGAAVLSYTYWRERFGADPDAIGRSIRISDMPFTIAGVAPPEFFGVAPGSDPQVYIPVFNRAAIAARSSGTANSGRPPMFADAGLYWVDVIGRLRPGVTIERAQAEFTARFRQFVLTAAAGDPRRTGFPALWLQGGASGVDFLRLQYSKPLLVLMTMVTFILMIACANIASLLLARINARQREMAVRLSLGAGRLRVIRQLLTESVLIALPGGAAGLGVAAAGIPFLVWLLGGGRDGFYLTAAIDWRILAFTTAVTFATGILFGLAPAVEATRVDLAPALKETRAGTPRAGRRRIGLSSVLIVVQVALSLLLVLGAVLFVRTLANLHSLEAGFNAERVLTFNLNASKAGYKDAALAPFYADMRQRLAALPGVRSVTMTNFALARRAFRTPIKLTENPKAWSGWLMVGPGFFETMEIPILLGRSFDNGDTVGSPPAAVVNEVFARKYFPDAGPIGRQVGILDGKQVTIVGVAGNVREVPREEIPPYLYFPYAQNPGPEYVGRGQFFEVRTTGDPLALEQTVRKLVQEIAPDVPVTGALTQAQRVEGNTARERTFAELSTAFAVLALAIACVGVYGTMAYAVSRRTNEIGIRMALGAGRGGIIRLVLSDVAVLAAVGLAIGLGVAWSLRPAVESLVYGVKPADPGAVAAAVAILIAALLAAGYAPAARAARIDPFTAVRHE